VTFEQARGGGALSPRLWERTDIGGRRNEGARCSRVAAGGAAGAPDEPERGARFYSFGEYEKLLAAKDAPILNPP
jgi:hypothetical protein